MRKLRIMILLIGIVVLFSGCSNRPKLLILNWGEYINDEVVANFEEEYNVDVIMDIGDSNEMFYSNLKSGVTAYDLVVPSEYMVDKMVSKDLLQKINFDLLPNYDPINNPYLPGVLGIQGEMFDGFADYTVPYFWGTFGLMYNKNVAGLQEALQNNGWGAFFDETKRPSGVSIGMYDVSRFAYAAALLYNNHSPNEATDESLDLAEQTLYNLLKVDDKEWGTDTLKKNIMANNLDLAFVYTGDFLDMLYIKLETTPISDIKFDIYIPDNTIAFMDNFVIPKNARHVELAHKFMNYLLDPEVAYLNAQVVGYCTPLAKAYDMIVNNTEEDPWYKDWAYATQTYYPLPAPDDAVQFKGVPLANLDRDFLTKIDTMVNNVKAKTSK